MLAKVFRGKDKKIQTNKRIEANVTSVFEDFDCIKNDHSMIDYLAVKRKRSELKLNIYFLAIIPIFPALREIGNEDIFVTLRKNNKTFFNFL